MFVTTQPIIITATCSQYLCSLKTMKRDPEYKLRDDCCGLICMNLKKRAMENNEIIYFAAYIHASTQ